MQDNWQDFDRQVRSMLQDAEVKAPRRVWRAVSKRLDSAQAAVAWWKWAVPAFAAAALAVGLFFNWGGGPSAPAPDSLVAQVVTEAPSQSTPAESSSPAVEQEQIQPEAAPSSTAAAPVRRSSARRSTSGKNLLAMAESTELDSKPAEEPSSISETEAPVQQETEQEAAPVSSTSNSDSYSAEDAARWAQIEKSARTQRIRMSGLYAQGGVGGNDSNISYGGTGGISRMAPGAGSADAGISESGSSTYGVPFTLGLGTRFNLSEKFSLGTGLEYSLLTRTFNGTYSDSYTGGIYHAVQYVGVPVNAYYNLLSTKDGLLNLYAWGGGAAEICVSNSYRLMSSPGSTIKDKAGALQFSAALGIGVEIPLGGKLSLYLDPAVRYYFHGDQPKSLRTDKPFMFNFDAGLRFNL